MNPQLRSHFRGCFTTIEPQLHRMLLERLVKLLPGLLGFDHRCIHTGIVFRCLSLPVSVKSAQPHHGENAGYIFQELYKVVKEFFWLRERTDPGQRIRMDCDTLHRNLCSKQNLPYSC